MWQRCVWVSLLGVCFLLGCSGTVSRNIVIPEATIESAVSSYFPLSSEELSEKDFPAAVTLSEPDVILQEGSDQLQLRVNVAVQPEKKLGTGVPLPPRLPGRPGGLLQRRDQKSEQQNFEGTITVASGVEYKPEEAAFYLLDPKVTESSLKVVPEPLVEPARRAAAKLLSKYFKENSVYTLPDDDMKYRAAKVLLKSVSVQEGKLIVELGL